MEPTRRRFGRLLPGGVAITGVVALAVWLGPDAVRSRLLPGADEDAAPEAVVVTMSANRFQPGTVRVRAGGTVTWRNTSELVHTVTGSGFDSGNVGPGRSYSRTFARPGTYRYWCVPHRQAGMTGTVIVES